MKIVVLDGYTLNPGDLDWSPLEQLGPCDIYDRTPKDKIVERARGAPILLTNKVPLDEQVIGQLPDLNYIGVLATGFNVVDVSAATAKGIPVTNVPEYGTNSVAQMVFAHILNIAQQVALHSAGVRSLKWSEQKDFCYWETPLVELYQKKLGIIGFGRIGKVVAHIGRAFGMQILVYDPHAEDMSENEKVEFDYLIANSDVISLHAPLTEETKHLIDNETLGRMKKSAILINCSRGQLVDESALYHALKQEQIAAAGADVLSQEPPDNDNLLLKAQNCYITPHIAWATVEARKRLLDTVVENIKAFLRQQPQNVVNKV
ncbi:D-2-hydroxyacid dehydrogenase [candidate division KSB1 bacterium]|nr:D-2-hydroxyacid dehydrogenase [candidate division KSB1 bacterium]